VQDDQDSKLFRTAYHEAAHITIAAVMGIPLLHYGFCVDDLGEGIACFRKEPEDTRQSYENTIVTFFSGYKAQKRFCDEHSYPDTQSENPIDTCDWREARALLIKLPSTDVLKENIPETQEQLEKDSEKLVAQYWLPIQALAHALTSRDSVTVEALKRGPWSRASTARCVTGA
jgi:hypothetical protein